MEISFFVDKKSKIFCAGGITERQTRKVTETQKNLYDAFFVLLLMPSSFKHLEVPLHLLRTHQCCCVSK